MNRTQSVARGENEKGEALLVVAGRRVGLRKAMKVLTYMTAWEHVREDLGRAPTAEEYAKWWRESNATAYREQALFRQAFPDESTPARLLDLATEQANVRRGVATALGATLILG